MAVRQHTQDVRGCPCVCPSAHTGSLWLSISKHISTLALLVDCLGDFGQRGLSIQYTQDVRWCLPAHTGRPWQSVAVCQHTQDVRGCPCVSVSTHRMSVAVHQYTYQHVGPWTQHADPSRGLFGTSVAVCVCPSVAVHQYTYQHVVHTGRPWVSAITHRTSVAVHVCPCVSVSTHRTSMAVHQYTYQHAGPWTQHVGRWTQHAGPSRGLLGTHISTLVLGLSTLTLPVDCSGDFVPRGLSVQYTQDHTQDFRGCPSVHISARCTHRTSVGVRQHTQDVRGCPWQFVSTHRTSVAVRVCPCVCVGVRQHTQDVRGCPWLSYTLDVRGCLSAHTGCTCVSVSTHRTSVAVRVCPCVRPHTQDVCGCPSVQISARCTHRKSVGVHQHTQDVCGCLLVSVSTHKTSVAVRDAGPWTEDADPSCGLFGTSVAVRVCPCVFVTTHMTSIAVDQYTYQHVGPWTQHASPSRGLTQKMSVAVRVCSCVSVSTHRTSVGVRQRTQDVRVCPTHISTLVLGLSTLALPVDCSGDFGPRGLSVQYNRTSVGVRQHTKDVCGCPSAHTGRPWLSVCVRDENSPEWSKSGEWTEKLEVACCMGSERGVNHPAS
ncbi:hypothetical protein YC2023_066119 [Brassica napus]